MVGCGRFRLVAKEKNLDIAVISEWCILASVCYHYEYGKPEKPGSQKMNQTRRTNGKLIRRIAKLDRAWRLAGQQEGRVENKLAFELGNASRAGMGDKARRTQCASAARLGQRSGWESKI